MSRWNSTRKMWEYGEGGSVSFLRGGGGVGSAFILFQMIPSIIVFLFVTRVRELVARAAAAAAGYMVVFF